MRYFTRYAKTMAEHRTWYEDSCTLIDELYGADADLFKRMLAATSQNATIRANVSLAKKALEQYKNGMPFDGFLQQVINNLERIVKGLPCKGPKINAFERAMTGDHNAVVVDLHMTELFYNRKTPTIRQLREITSECNKVAKKLNWHPRQAQAALWAYNHRLRGNSPPSYTQYLEAI